MSLINVNGESATSIRAVSTYYGASVINVALSKDKAIAGQAITTIGDRKIKGTVVPKQQAGFAGTQSALIVGGAGGWRNDLPPKGYSHAAGVRLSAVLNDGARASGETISIDKDKNIGLLYARKKFPAEFLLELLLDGKWWIDDDGVTQTKARDASPISTPFTVVSYNPALGLFEIATEFLAPWQPGRTFSTATVPDVQEISSVTIDADEGGKLRLHVLVVTSAVERMRNDFRSLVRQEMSRLAFTGTWSYTVAPSQGLKKTVDITPVDPSMPPLTNVPLSPDMGVIAPPSIGTGCRIRFVNNDPSKPEVVSFESSTEHLMTAEACALLVYNTLSLLMTAAGGGPLFAAVLQPLLGTAVLGALTAQGAPAPSGLSAQLSAAASQLANFATGVPATTSLFFKTVIDASAAGKTLDISGAFPSVGVPHGG